MTTKTDDCGQILSLEASEIGSTFDSLDTPGEYEAVHACGSVLVMRSFEAVPTPRITILQVLTVYMVEGEEVGREVSLWGLSEDGDTLVHSGETIEEFARTYHEEDPVLDIEYATIISEVER